MMDACCLVTGGAGFFGDLLKRHLIERGARCVSLDLAEDPFRHPSLVSVRGDLRDAQCLERLFRAHRFDAVFHCAAVLAHENRDRAFLRESNVDGTHLLAETMARHGVRRMVFTSSNCVYARDYPEPVPETEPPCPAEIYGASKLEAERVLAGFAGRVDSVVLRTPTILDEGRLGLLAILFEFVADGKKAWLVGRGDNRYQFVYGRDLADACVRALDVDGPALYHVGAERVRPLREVFAALCAHAGTGARVASLPRTPTLLAMRAAHALRLSPLGPYHRRMIASNFVFDCSRIRTELGWRPTLTNEEMLVRAYDYFAAHREAIEARRNASAHRRPARMGVVRLLKWLS